MATARLLATVVAVALLAACTRSPYVYVKLTDENVKVVESGEPPLPGRRRWGGDAIPVRYALEEPGVSLELAVGNETFVPSLEIVSSVPLREVSIGSSGSAIRKSELEYKLIWGSSHAGTAVQIRIDLEGRASPLLLSGVVTASGTVYSSDSL